MFHEIITHDFQRPLRERAKARKFCGPYRWRPSEPGKGRGFYQACNGLHMDRAGSTLDLRLELANDCLPRSWRRPDAYWADDDGFTKLIPIVARLPHSRGFLAGWTMGEGMCASLEPEVFHEIEDAARAAHDAAEHQAEAELERSVADRLEEELNPFPEEVCA